MPGPRTLNKLTAKKVQTAPPGVYEDGGGLRLIVEESGARRFTIRFTLNGRRLHKGLGGYPAVSLEEAREKARDYRKAAKAGRDAAVEVRSQRSAAVIFEEAFDRYFDVKRLTLSNSKHIAQWRSTMTTYVFPHIGDRPVADITASEIIDVLRPIWFTKAETAARVLQRVEATFTSAILHGFREKASPCIGVAAHLGPHERNVGHHDALPYGEIPRFLQRLRGSRRRPATRLALELLILTACRSQEVRGAVWAEIDLDKRLWTIPAARLKTRRKRRAPHVIPLASRCLEILKEAKAAYPTGDLIFPGAKTGKLLSDNTLVKTLRDMGLKTETAHGFRSSFKDWCAEVAKVRDEVSEAALAHSVGSKVKAAYLRTDFLGERVGLMTRWDNWLNPATPS